MNESKLQAIFLLGTLKHKGAFSHTKTLCELVIEKFEAVGIESEIIQLSDFDIPPGLETKMTPGDEWPGILRKVLQADIIIFATPIWWGLASSLIQRVVERMDALNDELLETGHSELANKIGGIVITGAEDGAEHVIGNLCNFMIWNGLTIPPASTISYLGDHPNTKEKLLKKWRGTSTEEMAETAVRNLTFFAKLLKTNTIPEKEKSLKPKKKPKTP